MPFIRAKNGNVLELDADLAKEFVAQGHAGPFDTEDEALAGASSGRRSTRGKKTAGTAKAKASAQPKADPAPAPDPAGDDESEDVDGQEPAESEGESEPTEVETNEPTPSVERPGRGASQALWAAYADAIGVTYPAGAGRDEIRDAVEAIEGNGSNS